MDRKYKFEKGAEQDFHQAYEWYEEKQEGLGFRFSKYLFEKINILLKKPEKNPEDSNGIRKSKLQKFPFYIYYIVASPIIIIIAIWHTSRDLKNLKKRIDSKDYPEEKK